MNIFRRWFKPEEDFSEEEVKETFEERVKEMGKNAKKLEEAEAEAEREADRRIKLVIDELVSSGLSRDIGVLVIGDCYSLYPEYLYFRPENAGYNKLVSRVSFCSEDKVVIDLTRREKTHVVKGLDLLMKKVKEESDRANNRV